MRVYKGQATNLMGSPFLEAALRIHSVEARHASKIRRLRADFVGETNNEDALGWITLDTRGPRMPVETQGIYDGKENVTQGGVNLVTATGFSAAAVSQAYDDPVSGETAAGIAGLFIVSQLLLSLKLKNPLKKFP